MSPTQVTIQIPSEPNLDGFVFLSNHTWLEGLMKGFSLWLATLKQSPAVLVPGKTAADRSTYPPEHDVTTVGQHVARQRRSRIAAPTVIRSPAGVGAPLTARQAESAILALREHRVEGSGLIHTPH